MKRTRLINEFSEKILIWANGLFSVQKGQKECILLALDPL